MKQLMNNKKGIALNQAFGSVLILVVVAVLVIISIVMFVNIGNTFVNLDTTEGSNQTITTPNITAVFVEQSPTNNGTLCNYGTFAVTVTNASGGEIIDSPNYTITSTGSIVVSFDVDEGYNSTIDDWNVSYTANWGGQSCVASNAMITQFGTFPVLIGLVGTIIFLGLVIGVLVASFVFGGRKEGF